MFIQCPKCSAGYDVPENANLKETQKLKCSACGTVFEKTGAPPAQPAGKEGLPPVHKPEPRLDDVFKAAEPLELAAPAEKKEIESPVKKDLPEVFLPVQKTSRSRGASLVIGLIYVVFIVGLCWVGWTHRHLLKPMLSGTATTPEKQANPAPQPRAVRVVPRTDADEIDISLDTPAPPAQKTASFDAQTAADAGIDDLLLNAARQDGLAVQIQPVMPQPESPEPAPAPQQPAQPVVSETPSVPLPELPVPPAVADTQPLFDMVAQPTPMPAMPTPAVEEYLVIQDLKFWIEADEAGAAQLLIKGELSNPTGADFPIGELTAVIYNDLDEVIGNKLIHPTQTGIPAGQSLPFFTTVSPAPVRTARIDILY